MNPLLSRDFHIPFTEIKSEHLEPGIRAALDEAERALAALVSHEGKRTYDNTVQALDDLVERLARVVTIAQHLTMVATTPELRAAYNAVLPEFSSFFARLPLHEGLWQALQAYHESEEAKRLAGVKKRHLEKIMREFARAGAKLSREKKKRLEAIKVELSKLHTRFSENVLDATNAFELVITDEKNLSGLPESAVTLAAASFAQALGHESNRAVQAINQARESAKARGWRFTLQQPSYQPFMQYAENRELREKMYTAYMNRASEGELDNRPLISRILALRRGQAELLGYENFANYRLEENMVSSGQAALAFVRDLTARTEPFWREEISELTDFAKTLGIDELKPWDVAYLSEKLRRARYDFDEEALRPYFRLENVLEGMFEIAGCLFGITVEERPLDEVWHSEVKFYDILDEEGIHLGSFYADWFPRESKRAGAWMNALISGGPREEGFTPHLGLMVGNFTPPQEDKPALLTHGEVETTFHEFGHLLHHCLSRVEVAARSGTKVARDWVELPSQIMENWTWERQALDLFARHYETGERIPEELYHKMLSARNFMAASQQMRQLSFGTVDLELHINYNPELRGEVIPYVQEIMGRFAILPEFAKNHFIAAFTHVFTGSYAAGYYSYKWCEVLDADAFTRFKAEGIFNRETGRAYLDTILSRGDSAEPADLFRAFMGRDPNLQALLERNLTPAAKPVSSGG